MTIDTSKAIISCLASSHKRRRTSSQLHVRFCTQPQIITYYSRSDRDGLFFDMPSSPKEHKQDPFILLSINFFESPLKRKAKFTSKRPKLTIDTSNLSGPLYFTSMTTNHAKYILKADLEEDQEEEDPIDMETRENTKRNSLRL